MTDNDKKLHQLTEGVTRIEKKLYRRDSAASKADQALKTEMRGQSMTKNKNQHVLPC